MWLHLRPQRYFLSSRFLRLAFQSINLVWRLRFPRSNLSPLRSKAFPLCCTATLAVACRGRSGSRCGGRSAVSGERGARLDAACSGTPRGCHTSYASNSTRLSSPTLTLSSLSLVSRTLSFILSRLLRQQCVVTLRRVFGADCRCIGK